MEAETTALWGQVAQTGSLVAFMGVVIKYLVDQKNKSDERNNSLINQIIETHRENAKSWIVIVEGCKDVLERVERKLDAK